MARELRRRVPGISFRGLGGPAMASAGVNLLADLEDLAVMGFTEVARRLRFFRALRRRVYDDLERIRPDLVIPVDYPGFNLPLATRAHESGIPVLYFIAPQVWAWREKRAAKLAAVCRRILTVLPFEDELLRRYGADSRFVGHPLLDEPPHTAGADSGPHASAPLVGIFPGSRAQEVERMLPTFAAAADLLGSRHPGVGFQVARAPHIDDALYAGHGLPVGDAADTIGRARAAMTKSGTITLQLALAGVPMVVGYRTGRITYELAKRLVRVPSISLVNLVAGREVVPELVQGELTASAVATAVEPLLEEGPARREMVKGLERVRSRLGEPGCAGRVADHALELLGS